MTKENSAVTQTLLERALAGDHSVLDELCKRHEPRLRLLIDLRLDRRLRGREGPEDVLQETFLAAHKRFDDYKSDQPMPFYLWLRFLALQQAKLAYRKHFGVVGRNLEREESLYPNGYLEDSSEVIAERFADSRTSPSQAAERAELLQRLRTALDEMEPIDREVLVLRHFEQLNNVESARVLGVGEAAASRRYARALLRLKDVMCERGNA